MEVLTNKIERFLAVSSGFGDGSGFGSGDGYGYGYGFGSGDGDGYGYGSGLLSFNGQNVYYIDRLPTVIEHVRGNLAKGFVINKDLTTRRCCVVKGNDLFAHGDTVKEAEKALEDKIFETMSNSEKIDAFLEAYKLGVKYPAKDFYEWHLKLTGSCAFGRDAFCQAHGIDLENGLYTVEEFIEITKNDYGSSVIGQIEERIKG